ncbi:tetratricopeptide repeat protein [Panacibacter ginsenosidivorans]|uniref:Tetratricopeptide repeat protein n=1 Tax=Panacibacter ginsenosidivorans TaxID=1813871 RepID=A0A5B8VC57_9BACT|nr:tetratricopeptide repeat protein [Panacibacter ginsenosidivorans]QEC67858.1 tetratricopeptide repeat protein [Panacibacter ginsenosidivorans]
MKRLTHRFSCIAVIMMMSIALVHAQDADAFHETGRSFMRQGDFPSALQAFDKALELKPDDIDILKDKAFVFYLQRDFANTIDLCKKITARQDADAQSFQILGLAYKAIAETKESEKMYKQALTRFPKSGALNCDYGEFLSSTNPAEGIKYWERGIEADPNYSGNYYFATKYYAQKGNIIWGLLYGEIFVNIESLSKRTEEIKNILYGGYKKLFDDISILDNSKQSTSTFEKQVAINLGNLTSFGRYDVSPEMLTALRTRFILNWYNNEDSKKINFHLFEYQRDLLREGYFDAYNQWLIGPLTDSQRYTQWVQQHGDDVKGFQQYQRNQLFKMPVGQYYRH